MKHPFLNFDANSFISDQSRGASGATEDFYGLMDLSVMGTSGARFGASIFSRKRWKNFPMGRPTLYGQKQRSRLLSPGFLSRALRSSCQDDSVSFLACGRLSLLLRDFETAERCLSRSPINRESLFWRAQALILSGHGSRGLSLLDRVILHYPHFAWAYAWRAAIRGRKSVHCHKDLEKALSLEPQSAPLHVFAGWMGFRGGFDRGLSLQTLWPPGLLLRGEQRLCQNLFSKAARDFDAALRLDPECGWAHAMRGVCWWKLKDLDQARASWNRAVFWDPSFIFIFNLEPKLSLGMKALILGQNAFDAMDFGTALEFFRAAVAKEPQSATACAYLARQLHFNGENEKSFKMMERAFELDPECGWIEAWRGLALMKSGNLLGSLSAFNRAERLNPRYGGTYGWRGALYGKIGRLQDALNDLDLASDLGDQTFNTGLASSFFERKNILVKLKDYRHAFNDLRRAVHWEQKYCWNFGSANSSFEKSEWELSEAIASHPESAWGYAWRGHLKMTAGKWTAAVEDLNVSLVKDPHCAWAYAWRGECYRHLGLFDKALKDFNDAARLDSRYAMTFVGRGMLHLCRKNIGGALSDFNKALKRDRACAHAYRARSVAWVFLKKLDQAKFDLRKAENFNPTMKAV